MVFNHKHTYGSGSWASAALVLLAALAVAYALMADPWGPSRTESGLLAGVATRPLLMPALPRPW